MMHNTRMRLACSLASALVGTTLAIVVATASATQPYSPPGSLRSAQQGPESFKRLYDFGLGKRASYVAEYKRLPMYDFGIGKRAGFGSVPGGGPPNVGTVGAAPPNMYAFGLGKRFDDEADSENEFDISQNDVDDSSTFGLNKGGRLYNLGRGKRSRLQYAFGIGKRPADIDSRLEDVLLGAEVVADADGLLDVSNGMDHHDLPSKRRTPQYSFGLGKRRGRYDFGIGKRTPSSESE